MFDTYHIHTAPAGIKKLLKQIVMTQEELAQQLTDLKAQTDKAREEIVAKVADLENQLANVGVTTPAVIDALNALKASVQSVDDLNADAPVEPEQPTTPEEGQA